jgi:hypothetical protein
MMPVLDELCVYHITHVDNLPSILTAQGLWSDAEMSAQGGPTATIGMSSIKRRRLALPVVGHPGLMVGDCVPFYWCPRSVMLYLIHKGNHPELSYKGGQSSIVHLEALLVDVVAWAEQAGLRWAFSLSNAGARYTTFRTKLADLGDIHWAAVQSDNWRDPDVKEAKQAELLLERHFPFDLVHRIGVQNATVGRRVHSLLACSPHRPRVEVLPAWYY